jgi:hypothetical protein
MSFLRHVGIYRSDDFYAAGSERLGSLPALIGLDELQPAIPWQIALQQSLPPLHRPPTILKQSTAPYNDFSANGYSPLNLLSHSKGAVQFFLDILLNRRSDIGMFVRRDKPAWSRG